MSYYYDILMWVYKKFVKNSPSDVTVQGCIDNLPAGNYTVYVYDVENDIPLTSILPAIILRDIVITDISTTSKLILNTLCSLFTDIVITVTSSPTSRDIIIIDILPSFTYKLIQN